MFTKKVLPSGGNVAPANSERFIAFFGNLKKRPILSNPHDMLRNRAVLAHANFSPGRDCNIVCILQQVGVIRF